MAINDYLSDINQATAPEKAAVTQASTDLANLQAGAGSLPSKLKEALNTKLNNNKDIINQQADTMGAYFNAGPQAREKYQGVFNPFQKAALVQNERTMALRPYDVLSGVLENRMGTVNDLVQSGIQGWQGLLNAAGTKADTAKSLLSNAMSSYMNAAGLQRFDDNMAMQKDQFDRSLNQKASSGSGGGGIGSITDIMKLIETMNGNKETSTAQPTEPTPDFIPQKPNVQYHSPGGQWIWNNQEKEWFPTFGTLHVIDLQTLEEGDLPVDEYDPGKYKLFK
jgi:hypothetical protein